MSFIIGIFTVKRLVWHMCSSFFANFVVLKCLHVIIPISGDFVFIEPIEEGDRVKAEICRILYKEQIKFIKDEGKW